jgi:hypothetical protein
LKIIRKRGNHLRNTAITSLIFSIVFAVALVTLGLTTDPYLPIAVNWREFTNLYAVLITLLASGAVYFFRKYQSYKQGFQGESRVSDFLIKSFVDDEHFLIDDLVYVNDNGYKENIDHIVLAPNGIFALETKDYRGKISNRGSFWTLPFPFRRSPTKQVQGNAYWTQKVIKKSGILQNTNLWVEPIIVFSNPEVELERINPEVTVVKLDELASFLASYDNGYRFTTEQLKAIGEELLRASLSD